MLAAVYIPIHNHKQKGRKISSVFSNDIGNHAITGMKLALVEIWSYDGNNLDNSNYTWWLSVIDSDNYWL